MLSDASLIAFVATTNPELARGFYEDTLRLRFVDDSPFALVFESSGVEMRVQKVDAVIPPTGTALGWKVGDIARAIGDLTARGVVFERFPFLE